MCGVGGVFHHGSRIERPVLQKMADSLRHRGPDDEGFHQERDISLFFRRLSILDLQHGRQPMTNETGDIWSVFNGEIYNHLELRKKLIEKGYRFKTDHSDSEVFVHGWSEWGVDLFPKLNGMFACAIWDRRRREVCLARDRYGIKPLYYSVAQSGEAIFASEVRAIHASGLIAKEPDHEAVLEYFCVQNNWRDRTPFKGVRLVPAGSYMIFGRAGHRTVPFWQFSARRKNVGDFSEAVVRHQQLLKEAIDRNIQADVPVRSYLSGGIDSSAITVLAHRRDQSITAYSCIFNLNEVKEDRHFDEREYSRAVAKHINTSRTEFEVQPTDLEWSLEKVIDALEYPMMGMSYVNYLIAKRVAADGKVVLSGTGGDEIHAGYIGRYQCLSHRRTALGDLAYKLTGLDRDLRRYRKLLNPFFDDRSKFDGLSPDFLSKAKGYSVRQSIDAYFDESDSDNYWDLIMNVDAKTYLHGLLVLEDKLSMSHSLETRVPLLDNELVDFVLTVPWEFLTDRKSGKIIFRESVKDFVPESIYAKPKMGFGPPDASWYRSHLQSWIRKKLSPETIKRRGVLNNDFVQDILRSHFAGEANRVSWIWSFLCFETWCDVHGFYGGRLA